MATVIRGAHLHELKTVLQILRQSKHIHHLPFLELLTGKEALCHSRYLNRPRSLCSAGPPLHVAKNQFLHFGILACDRGK